MATSPALTFEPAVPPDFWIQNLQSDPRRLAAMEARWSSPVTRAQLKNPWQQIAIDGQQLPGVWKIKKIRRKVTAQVNKKSGADGGPVTFRGLLNAQFEATGQLYVPSHYVQWLSAVHAFEVVARDPMTRGQHLIETAICALSGVRQVVILELEYEAPESGGPLGITLGLLGASTKDGATVAATNKPARVPSAAPTTPLNSASAPAQSLQQHVVPPTGAR